MHCIVVIHILMTGTTRFTEKVRVQYEQSFQEKRDFEKKMPVNHTIDIQNVIDVLRCNQQTASD